MKMVPQILFAAALACSGCAKSEVPCPSMPSDVLASLKSGGFTGALDADVEFMGRSSEYCLFRYEYVFGQSGRMSSRLIVFSEVGYLGSYAFSFDGLEVERDRIIVALPSGAKEVIMFQSIGSKLLIDGEPLTFYK